MSYDPRYQVSGISGGLPPLPKSSDLIHRSDVEGILNAKIAMLHGSSTLENILEKIQCIPSIQSVDVEKEIDTMIEELEKDIHPERILGYIKTFQELKQRLTK